MMELESIMFEPILVQQYKALVRKNFLVSWRNKGATFLRLFAPFVFFLFLFLVEKTVEASYSSLPFNKSASDPEGLVSPPIPPCEDKLHVKLPCFDFLWSGNESARIRTIVAAIMENNPGRHIPHSKVKSFRKASEVDAWLNSNPMQCSGALHFVERSDAAISYGLQTNSTAIRKRGNYEDPTFKFQIPLQIAVEREIARSLIGAPDFSWVVALKAFAHPAMEILAALDSAGPGSFLATAMFNFVFQMTSLISEKELKLRQAMTMMGLYDSAYWLSWLTFDGIMTFIASLLIVLFGLIFQFDIFLRNPFSDVFLVFFLFQLNMLGFAYVLSSFISKSSSSTTAGFSIFIIGAMTQIVTIFGFPYSPGISKGCRTVWSLFPPNLLAKAILLLNEAISTHHHIGTIMGRRVMQDCSPNHRDCVITLDNIYEQLLATFFLWLILAIYLDNIIPNAFGARKSVFYFLKPRYWTNKGGHNAEEGWACSCMNTIPVHNCVHPIDKAVVEEEKIVKALTRQDNEDIGIAVQMRGLAKAYPKTANFNCLECKKTQTRHTLKDLWLNVKKDQLFCLLGPNGAGKTTAMNCLTGVTPITGGDAFIYGNSVRSSIGMSNIRKLTGVCPQFDTLWDTLTGKEHLSLFASIKGINPYSIDLVIDKLLKKTGLTEAAKVRAESYSGGMRRRLSLAIALIGDPKLVILDEPTTGLDPISRKKVWDIIENSKRDRAMILTTHSMEEADILADRIGIMINSSFQCIGTSVRLKSRFGTGFISHVTFIGTSNAQTHQEAVKQFFKDKLDVVPKEENNVFLSFVTPHDKEFLLANFYAELQDRATEFGIADIQIGLTTLHEVFLNIEKKTGSRNRVE